MTFKSLTIKILNITSSIDNDKLLHFFYGTLLALFLSFFVNIGLPKIYVILITLTIAILKEVYDKFFGSGFDFADIFFTIASSVIIYFLL